MTNEDKTETVSQLDQQVTQLTNLAQQLQSILLSTRSSSIPASLYDGINQLAATSTSIGKQLRNVEEERISLRALAKNRQPGQFLAGSK